MCSQWSNKFGEPFPTTSHGTYLAISCVIFLQCHHTYLLKAFLFPFNLSVSRPRQKNRNFPFSSQVPPKSTMTAPAQLDAIVPRQSALQAQARLWFYLGMNPVRRQAGGIWLWIRVLWWSGVWVWTGRGGSVR